MILSTTPAIIMGKNGMEAIDVIENFIGDLAGKAGGPGAIQ